VLSQTIVRTGAIGHGPANAILLPHTIPALAWRFPREHEALAQAMGGEPAEIAARICALTGATALREAGVDHDLLAKAADAAAQRPDLAHTGPPADRAELLALYERAL
jgi:alcohol dehydrogenase class IV